MRDTNTSSLELIKARLNVTSVICKRCIKGDMGKATSPWLYNFVIDWYRVVGFVCPERMTLRMELPKVSAKCQR